MIFAMIYNSRTEEQEYIVKALRRAAAALTEERWQIDCFEKKEQLETLAKEETLLDLIGYEVSTSGSIRYLEWIRRRYQEAMLFLIADESLSPMEYIRPTILASSLLIRPLTAQKLLNGMMELVEKLTEKHREGEEEMLLIETREGRTYVPFSKIYYFEAREKRIYVRLKKQELTFYDTIEHLSERLPDGFIRCHRSFIVNRSRIQRVMLSKNLIELEQNMEIPLSRSYKPVFKELI